MKEDDLKDKMLLRLFYLQGDIDKIIEALREGGAQYNNLDLIKRHWMEYANLCEKQREKGE